MRVFGRLRVILVFFVFFRLFVYRLNIVIVDFFYLVVECYVCLVITLVNILGVVLDVFFKIKFCFVLKWIFGFFVFMIFFDFLYFSWYGILFKRIWIIFFFGNEVDREVNFMFRYLVVYFNKYEIIFFNRYKGNV